MSRQPSAYRTNDRRVIPWLLFGLAVLFGGLYVAAYLFTADRVPRGTTVSGIEIGGLTETAARARLEDLLVAEAGAPIRVSANGRSEPVMPAQAGLTVDVPASLARAGAVRSWRPADLWNYVAGGTDLDAVVHVDPTALAAAVATVAASLDDPARDGSITFAHGTVLTTDPVDGTVVDRSAAAGAVRAAFLGSGDVVALPTTDQHPAIDKREVSRAMDTFANPAVSAPVFYRIGRREVMLRPDDYAAALSMTPRGRTLVPRVDEATLLAALEPAIRRADRAPRDATVRLVHGRPAVVPARDGASVDPAAVTGPFLRLAAGHDRGRRLVVRPTAVPAKVSTADARSWGVSRPVAEASVSVAGPGDGADLARAAQLLDGALLRPGATLSFNQTVGERTAANGFSGGPTPGPDEAAGQVASALFDAALHAGLGVADRTAHASYVPGYPPGRDAAVAWPGRDLQIANPTPYGVLVQAWTDRRGSAVHVRLWSTPAWDVTVTTSRRSNVVAPGAKQASGPGCLAEHGRPGFDVDVTRAFRRPGSATVDHTDRVHTSYAPSDTITCA